MGLMRTIFSWFRKSKERRELEKFIQEKQNIILRETYYGPLKILGVIII
jgi:hypothetical protein